MYSYRVQERLPFEGGEGEGRETMKEGGRERSLSLIILIVCRLTADFLGCTYRHAYMYVHKQSVIEHKAEPGNYM